MSEDCSMDTHDALLDGLAPAGARAPGERPLTEADLQALGSLLILEILREM
jgi:hypothetical protein